MTRLPQGDSAELLFNEKAKMMDIQGAGVGDVRFESVRNDDEVVKTMKQGDQVKDLFNRRFNDILLRLVKGGKRAVLTNKPLVSEDRYTP